jgi:hypothetical protein
MPFSTFPSLEERPVSENEALPNPEPRPMSEKEALALKTIKRYVWLSMGATRNA